VEQEVHVLRGCSLLAVFLLIVPTVGAREIEERKRPYSSIKEGTGVGNPSTVLKKNASGRRFLEKVLETSDGEPFTGKSTGIVIVTSNTEEDGNTLCIDVDEPATQGDFDLLQAPLHSLIFKPIPRYSSILEIIWSGQVNVNSTSESTWGGFDQQTFFKCSVSQRGETVPCSGTAWIPTIVQDTTGDGITEWATYHGYVQFNPRYDVTVEIWAMSGLETVGAICGDTLTLKY